MLSSTGSAEVEHVSSLPVAKARSAKRAAKRSPPSKIAAPPKRQCQAEFQAIVLAHMEDLAGMLAAFEVRELRPFLLRAVMARRDGERKLLLEGRAAPTLLGAGARSHRIRLPGFPITKRCAAHRPSNRSTRRASLIFRQAEQRTFTGGKVRRGSQRDVKRSGIHRGAHRRRFTSSGGPCRRARTRHERPGIIIAADEKRSGRTAGVFSGSTRVCSIHCVATAGTSGLYESVFVMVEVSLREDSIGGFDRQHA